MCMCRIAVSNWELYNISHDKTDMDSYTDFLAGIAAGDEKCLGGNERPDILLVREKQLPETEYLELFARLWKKSREWGDGKMRIIPHTHPAAARQCGCGWLHLSFPLFQKYHGTEILSNLHCGFFVYSLEEAKLAQELGAAYVTAGHIFATDCKKGVPPRGLEFLNEVCESVRIPVYAIGGIHKGNLPLVDRSRAAGACMMSEYMFFNN